LGLGTGPVEAVRLEAGGHRFAGSVDILDAVTNRALGGCKTAIGEEVRGQSNATNMIQLEFRLEDRQALARERFEHPHPAVQRRMAALWLKSLALPHWLICQICGISGNTFGRAISAG
jgi:hypothetical protein